MADNSHRRQDRLRQMDDLLKQAPPQQPTEEEALDRWREQRRRRDEALIGGSPEAYTGKTIVEPRERHINAPAAPVRPERRQPATVRARRRPIRFGRWALLTFVLLLVVGGGALAWGYQQAQALGEALSVTDARPDRPLLTPLMLGGVNVLLVGVDERPDAPEEGVRSDTLIVAHLNAVGGYANLLSIPRDTVVTMNLPEGEVVNKINTTYGTGYGRVEELYGAGVSPQQGGMALAAQTVERFLGLKIHYTAQVNFDGFARLIDALGGVTIDVPKYILDTEYPTADFGIQTVEFQPGPQRMDGATALMYARTRHADSDFDRGARQQQVLRAMMNELRAKSRLELLWMLPELREGLRGTVVTTMPLGNLDVMAGAAMLARLDPTALGQFRISPETVPLLMEDGSDLYWDANGIAQQVALLTSMPGEDREAAKVQVFNGTGVTGLATQVTNDLLRAGFMVLAPSDAPTGTYPTTIVYDRTGKSYTSTRLAALLGVSVVRDPVPEGLGSDADLVVILGNDRGGR